VFYWPRGSQKAPKICFVRQLLPKPNKNGTKIDHKWDQSGPGWGKGQPKNDKKIIKKKKANVKKQNKKKTLFLKSGAIFSKIGGLNGWAFTEVFSTSVIKMTYKT
jgi:hypothetical protein